MSGGKLTKSQVCTLVEALRDIVGVLADADVEDKAALYAELGVSLTYRPTDECRSRHGRVGLRFVSEEGVEPPRTHRRERRTPMTHPTVSLWVACTRGRMDRRPQRTASAQSHRSPYRAHAPDGSDRDGSAIVALIPPRNQPELDDASTPNNTRSTTVGAIGGDTDRRSIDHGTSAAARGCPPSSAHPC